ncbi:matrixin family metalloprotease [Lentilactobacillus sp. Marseille-Q4993]|uniref:matrixin family metalloprotease n=1 Tax=Lentilactobacillus sp. Marseille-Q4993 TaxID=3039492 RepID=UPI0024BD2240|nr:matrixin family metalloprotease [Lentilactobacillus sp. Marseille-Q4993]
MKTKHLRQLGMALVSTIGLGVVAQIEAPVATAASKNVTPSTAVLKKSSKYYRKYSMTLAKKYKLGYDLQTGFNKKNRVKVYFNSKSKPLKKSLTAAMKFWNKKLGKSVFYYGSKKSHTISFSIAKDNPSSATDSGDAWWIPAQKKVQVSSYYYKHSTHSIKNEMLHASLNELGKEATEKVAAYAQEVGQSDPDYKTKVEAFRQDQITVVQGELTDIENKIDVDGIAKKGTQFEYANVLTHELGHVLGLEHSPSKSDVMYYAAQWNWIFDYKKVAASKSGYDPITKADQNRGKLAWKIYNARH